jgi:ketosteroid isomerase-like protein
MNYQIILISLIVSCSNLNSLAQDKRSIDPHTLAHLGKFRKDYSESLLQENPEILLNYYSENLRLMPEFQRTIMGRKNAGLYHTVFLSRFSVIDYSRKEMEILDLGKRVVESGHFTMTLKVKSSDRKHSLKGKYLSIWEKGKEGNLSLLTEAWNYNHKLEFEEQLRFAEISTVDVAINAHLPIEDNITFELAALNRLMETIVSQHDAQLWAQFYAEDGSFFYSRTPPVSGKKELAEFLTNHIKELPVFEKLDIRNDHVDELDNYAIEYASHIAIIRHGSFSGVFTGKDLRIWRREPNGSLKIFRHMAMYD